MNSHLHKLISTCNAAIGRLGFGQKEVKKGKIKNKKNRKKNKRGVVKEKNDIT